MNILDVPGFTFPTWKPLPGYEQAACKGDDVDKYHPETNAGIREAKMVCFWCPLGRNGGQAGPYVDSCLEYALDYEETGETHRSGIWGGSGPNDRARIARGELTSNDLFTVCSWVECDEPMPTAGVKSRFCSRECAYRARRADGKAA